MFLFGISDRSQALLNISLSIVEASEIFLTDSENVCVYTLWWQLIPLCFGDTDLWQRTNITIFTITHDVEEAIFLCNRIYALGSRPGTVRKEMEIKLPHRSHSIKRHSQFHDYRDELMDLLRLHGQEAMLAAA